jgi:hypothetical protein
MADHDSSQCADISTIYLKHIGFSLLELVLVGLRFVENKFSRAHTLPADQFDVHIGVGAGAEFVRCVHCDDVRIHRLFV